MAKADNQPKEDLLKLQTKFNKGYPDAKEVGRLKAMTSKQSRDMDNAAIMDPIKEAVGWQTKSGKPGLVQGLARTS